MLPRPLVPRAETLRVPLASDTSPLALAMARERTTDASTPARAADASRLLALFDLSNVSPICVSRALWLRAASSATGKVVPPVEDETFPFDASPTAAVFAPTRGRRAKDDDARVARAPVKAAAVVKSQDAGRARTTVPTVTATRANDDDDDDGGAIDGVIYEEDRNALFEAQLRRAMAAEAAGVDVGRMLAAKGGLANSPPKASGGDDDAEANSEGDGEAKVEDDLSARDDVAMDVDAPVEFVNSPVNSPAVEASPPASAAEDDAFERMLSAALKETRGASTPIEKQPLDRAVPKREFKPKLEVKSPEKYEPAAKPTPSTSALDFEAKLEAAMRAAEAGGDLTAILSGPSSKTANSPVGTTSAEARVNYRELGFTKAERRHHSLHVETEEAASERKT